MAICLDSEEIAISHLIKKKPQTESIRSKDPDAEQPQIAGLTSEASASVGWVLRSRSSQIIDSIRSGGRFFGRPKSSACRSASACGGVWPETGKALMSSHASEPSFTFGSTDCFAAEVRHCSAESSLFCLFQTERMFSFQSLTSHVLRGPRPSS
ncbi:hypothetical protein ACB094_02G135400 [Castanea mollissima]